MALLARRSSVVYSVIETTTPAPTVLPPSRMAKRCFSSIAIGVISSTAGLSFTGRTARADASIVDENVESVTFLADGVGKATHPCERGKIRG